MKSSAAIKVPLISSGLIKSVIGIALVFGILPSSYAANRLMDVKPEFNSEVRHSTIKQLTGETPPQAA